MNNQHIDKTNPFFCRLKSDEIAKYVFSFTLKYFYMISAIFIFVSVINGFKIDKFLSALFTLLLTILLHKYKSRLIAGLFIFIASGNFLFMAVKSADSSSLIFQLVIVLLCIRSWQAISYFKNNETISNDQTA
ncbi:MAG: hypothetical protein ABR936_17075 [Bacteroidota bacterium]|jgi:hypothetical protein